MANDPKKEEIKAEANGQVNQKNESGPQGGRQEGGGGGGGRRGGFGGRGGGGGRFQQGRRSFGGNQEVKNPEGGNDNKGEHGHGGGGGGAPGGGGRGGGGRGPRGRREGGGGPPRERNPDGGGMFINERLLKQISSGPTLELPPSEHVEKKFNTKSRLYLGNIPPDATEDDFKNLLVPFGEYSELYVNKEKNFAFVRMDYKSTAERVRRELDSSNFMNRVIKVRFAPMGSTLKVKNLTQYVTNELLELAFSVFGEIEKAVVFVDERGTSLREGLVEFARKQSAQNALRFCTEGCYFLTNSLRPVIVEPYNEIDDTEGFGEKQIVKRSQDFFEAREIGPRFAKPGSFEYEYGTRWKQIYELYRQKEDGLKRELKLEEEKLEAQMQYAKYEHETELLREQLRQRELDRERQKREWEIKERKAEEQRVAEEEALRRQQEEMSRRMVHQDDELRRRQQENTLFMQENNVRKGGDRDFEQDNFNNFQGGGGGGQRMSMGGGPVKKEPGDGNFSPWKTAADADMGFTRNRGYDARDDVGGGGRIEDMATRRPQQGGGGRWGHQERRNQNDDYPNANKRRRF